MPNDAHTPPHRTAVRAIAAGLSAMALFTLVWTGVAQTGLRGGDHYCLTTLFGLLSLSFIAFAAYLIRTAARERGASTVSDKMDGRRAALVYSTQIIAVSALVLAALFVLRMFRLAELLIPVAAGIFGSSFWPVGRAFRRGIDLYLGSWACLIGAGAVVVTLQHSLRLEDVHAFEGIGISLGTAAYGLYLIYAGRRLLRGKTTPL